MRVKTTYHKLIGFSAALLFISLVVPSSAYAQGSIFGAVQNSDLSTPANGEISFFGYLDNTDEEIRIEISTGAGYDAGNWFDDFQNYLTEAPGNPYDYHFYNMANGEGFQLSKTIPNNSFQQEDILLAAVAWPAKPAGLTATVVSTSSVVVSWNFVSGQTYHVYRRLATSDGSFFRIDDPTGSLANPGVADSFFIDNTVDGVSSYDYLIIAEGGSGNLSQHSDIVTVSSASAVAPVVASITPDSGLSIGGTVVTIIGSGFDIAGADPVVGAASLTSVTVVSPYEITGTTQSGAPGPADVYVTNTASGLVSNTLTGGYTYVSNSPPVLAAIGSQSGPEGALLTFTPTATDPDGGFPVMTSSALPGTATYVDNGDGTGTFEWTPTFTDAGTYNVTFYATDDVQPILVDSEQVVITINEAGNQTPVLATIGTQSTTENVQLTFGVSATDPDGTTPSLSTSALPGTASFVDNGDGTGSFDWTPGFTEAGSYDVTFYAGDGSATDSEVVTINVIDAGNQPPVLASIGSQSTTEGVLLTFGVSATDADGTNPALTTSTLPGTAAFVDNGDGTGTFDWTPSFTAASSYDVIFYADDGVVTDSEVVTINVLEAGNQRPVLATIGAHSTTEGILLSFGVSATDPDGTTPTLTTSTLPGTATFVDNGDGTGAFDWTPSFTDAGTYQVTFYADDGVEIDSEIVTIDVIDAGNQPPVLATIGSQSTTEGVLLSFGVSASDPDANVPALTTSALPGTAAFVDNGDGTGSFDWTPSFTDAGTYQVTFYADDGIALDSEIVTIDVIDAGNQPPELASIGSQATTEGVLLSFGVSASDPDATIPALTTSSLPGTATFVDNGDGTGSFDWTPSFTDVGTYQVTFYASDGLEIDSEIVTIDVLDAGNQAPQLASIGAQSTTEGILLSFGVSATDPDGTIPSLTSSSLPGTAAFVDNGDGTGSFDWTPSFTDSGTYLVTFYASDGVEIDSEIVTIDVLEAGNQPPELAAIGSQGTTEGVQLLFSVSATDPDATIPALTASALPGTAVFTDNGDGTGDFDWTPGFTDVGTYQVTFYASDGIETDSEQVTITVADAGNQSPELAAIGAQTTTENVLLAFGVSASDPDGTIPALTTSALPGTATFIDNGDGTGNFDWTPSYTDSGIYLVTFYASDGVETDSEVVTITVIDAGNQQPVLDPIGPQFVDEGVQLIFNVTASDPDGIIPFIGATGLPGTAAFTDSGTGIGTFDWTPSFTDAGVYDVTFYTTDGVLSDTEIVTITVQEVGNQAPIIDSIGPQVTSEGVQLLFDVMATDPDGSIPTMTSSTPLPGTATFVDNGDGTGTFDWTPTLTDSGSYSVTFYASDGLETDSEQVVITVTNANQEPVLASIGPKTINEGSNLNFGVSAADPDGDIPLLSAAPLPGAATFLDNGDGTGVFDWTPTQADSGTYLVTFYATDGAYPTSIDSEIVSITVGNVNQLPVLNPIGTQQVVEGDTMTFQVTGSDPDGDIPLLTAGALPGTATYTDNGNGTADFYWETTELNTGVHTVTFYATDPLYPTAVDSEVVSLVVGTAGNQPPIWTTVLFDTSVNEGSTLILNVAATDPDGDSLILTINTFMDNISFVDNNDGTGVFTYTPDYEDAGIDTVRFKATDNGTPNLTSILRVFIDTRDVNQPPVIDTVGPFGVEINDTLEFTITASDPSDPDSGLMILSAANLPTNASFVDNEDNTGTFTFSPVLGQEGLYTVTFLATDQDFPQETGTLPVDIQVVTVNFAPVLDSIGPQIVLEGEALTVSMTASDPDGTIPFFEILNQPDNSNFTDNGDGTALFTFNPSFLQAGLYYVTFRANDGMDIDKEVVIIQVQEAGDQAPFFTYIPTPTITETDTLGDSVIAFDPEGDPLTLSIDSTTMPEHFTFTDRGDSVALFSFMPDYTQSGTYDITIFAEANGLVDTGTLTIIVQEIGNQDPLLDTIPDYTIGELNQLLFTVTASDVDGVDPILSASPLPGTATFSDNGDGTGLFNWSPSATDSGSYVVTFRAEDAEFAGVFDSQDVTITVVDTNRAPFIFVPTGQTKDVDEDDTLTLLVTASDPDGSTPRLNAVLSGTDSLATNMTFFDSGNGSGVLTFAPDFTQGNTNPTKYYPVFQAIDEFDSTLITSTGGSANTINVYNVPRPPQLVFSDSTWPFTLNEGDSLGFTVAGFDPDGVGIERIWAENIPSANVDTFTALGQLSFIFEPDFTQSGAYQVLFIAEELGALGLRDSQYIDINVLEVGNQTPYFTDTLPTQKIVYLGFPDSTDLFAIDPDADLVVLEASDTLTGAVLVDNGDGTGYYLYNPDTASVGLIFPVSFYVTDPSGAADTISTEYRVQSFKRGDADGSGMYTMNDVVYMINYVFRGGPEPVPFELGDADMNGAIEVADIVYMVNFMYKGGPRPPQ